ncbi:2-oxo acid dehydrogenase subunit E2 [Gordonia humi]|uniref:Dihydrolipoamide acetyltransferase component of pyruvate dehydrogenase complex n=1 Tax=Gordonia humi TaxID=686429 RepID=A0A840F797_9ACTN|nr:2-oxo acid dehydrogenase subunit E2 [Gordonia humi]MBB4137756.1 2-oxoglutarate dehydrogenase E2 component (dihydrolipoamide succinyltransferase) [Gordonia humi]
MSNTSTTTTIVLPSLGESVTEATITTWLKVAGEHVEKGEPLLEVATDKVDTEVPSPATGVLLEILIGEDEQVEVGGAVATIGATGGDTRSSTSAPDAVSAPELESTPESTPEPAPAVPSTVAQVTPPSLSTPSDDRVRTEKLPRIRRTIAQRMLASLQTSAQLTSVVEVDVTEIVRLRARTKDEFLERTGTKLSFLPFFVAAAVDALRDHAVINSSLDPECTEVTYHDYVHLGMAVDSEKGLMVPVIFDADRMSLTELAKAIGGCADRVRAGTIAPDELSGGTFTITNTGSRGALFDTPIINQPQSAILGIGSVVERLVPIRDADGLRIEARSMAYLSLSYDHRIVDGADAARYLTAVRTTLESEQGSARLI